MANIFDSAFDELMKFESDYSNDKHDPGGETKYGISSKYNPELNIEDITLEQAKNYYRINWWEKNNYHLIYQPEIAKKVFITAVNIGAREANRLLQEAISLCGEKTEIDGSVGKQTLSNLNKVNRNWFIDCYRVLVAKFYVGKVDYDREKMRYIVGWLKRALA